MRLIGCDLHAAQQTLAILDRDTGEVREAVVHHEGDQVRRFYAGFPPPSSSVWKRPTRCGGFCNSSRNWVLPNG